MIPRLRFAHLPTAIEPLPRLSTYLGGPRLMVKRDDQTGLGLGGNKTRKLETLVADAQSHGARALITAGAIQSNHCRQTAAAAARFGMECTLVLIRPANGVPEAIQGNLFLDGLFGANIIWCDPDMRDQTLQKTFETAWEAGKRPYLIPYGGSNPVGASAYALAFQEFLEQKQPVDWIVFASSSGGTQAGLVAGACKAGWKGKILGISVDEEGPILTKRVERLAHETAGWMGLEAIISTKDVLVNDEYRGGGYAVMGKPEQEAIQLFASQEGLLLDPVYTGRAAAGLIDLIRRGMFKSSDTILFWHTGGTPALFADPYTKMLGILHNQVNPVQ